MTTVAAFGRPPATPSAARSLSRPRRRLTSLLVLVACTAAGMLPLAVPAVSLLFSVGAPVAAAAVLLVRAPATSSPRGWRCYAVSVLLTGGGGLTAMLVTGVPGAVALGGIPGEVLGAAAVLGMTPRSCWGSSRARVLITGALFFFATLLALDITASFVPTGGAAPTLLRVALIAVPATAAVSTATALLFLAGNECVRQDVAAELLAALALSAGAAMASLFAWGGSAAAALLIWPAVLTSCAAIVLACLRDGPVRLGSRRPSAVPETTTSLLPHAMAFLAGGAALLKSAFSSGVDVFQGWVGLTMLAALVAHQAVMWRTQRGLTGDLRRSESFFRTLVKSSVDPVVILDDQLRVTFASPTLSDLVGVDPSRAVGRSLTDVVHPDDAPAVFGAIGGRRSGETAVRTARLRHADGTWRLIQASVRDLREDPDVGALVLFCRDVSPRTPERGVDPELLELSLTDSVTGLPNRTALVRRLGAVQRAGIGGRPAALALIGVSGLAGSGLVSPSTEEAVLRALTARLTRALRGEDWLARGKNGDFIVLVDGSIADAEVVASRLVADVGSLMTPDGPVRLTASAGVAGLPADVDPGEALRRCSVALHSAEHAGPGSVHRYDDALRMQQDRSAALRADLDGAVERDELRLVFQPVVDLVLHRTVSVEALLRWRHPVFGDVPPVEFVPLAEESPLIGDVGRWVLREACSTIAALPDTDLGVAVNVSARQVRSGELVPDVLAALEASGLPASRLIVEITESVLMDDGHVIEDLTVLRQLGVRIAVDDFGTGWSSLAYLVGLPIDVLKMDQHFVTDVEHDPQRQALCRAVLQLGSSLGLPVIVEGVTSEAQLDLLSDMGHRFLQGFVLSRPLEAEQLADGGWRARDALAAPIPAPRSEVTGAPPVVSP